MNPTLWLLTSLIAGLLITWAFRVDWSTKGPRVAPGTPETVDSKVDEKVADGGDFSSCHDRYCTRVPNQRGPVAPTGQALVYPVNTRTVEAKAQAAARHDAYTGKRTANPYRSAIRARLWLASYQSALDEHLDA
jgi:hypothetical protein